jgi:acetyl-CoA carboxylase biotin carboxyl carrier protein
VDLTNEDVADILALLDSLPYDSLDVETPRFRLTLRRAPGGWTEESQVFSDPALVTPARVTPARVTPAPVTATPNGASATPHRAPGAADGSSSADAGAAVTADVHGGGGAGATAGVSGDGGTAGDGAASGPSAGSDGLVAVATPLPGTFYRAPQPGAAPFVEVGDAVGPDTVVAIVETMKLMNSVHAGLAGRVMRICLENGEFAALGTTLILIEPQS